MADALFLSDCRRAKQDLAIRREILQRRSLVSVPRSDPPASEFWAPFAYAFAEAYGQDPILIDFRETGENLDRYAPASRGTCVLYSGGVESTYVALLNPSLPRFTIRGEAEVHPRGGEMFIKARAAGYRRALYGGDEKEWGEREDGCCWDWRTGRWVASEAFEFSMAYRSRWAAYLGIEIECPTTHLFKDEIVEWIYSNSKDAYYALQSCCILARGWCGYCDKCLITGAIIEALRLPPLFRMKPSIYSEEIKGELARYQTGDYDPYGRLPIFRRLQEHFGYTLTV
jgi:hypothetical protein